VAVIPPIHDVSPAGRRFGKEQEGLADSPQPLNGPLDGKKRRLLFRNGDGFRPDPRFGDGRASESDSSG
jgi:hypothetical protein